VTATLLVRADAGPVMGTGHVMRCLALAHAWRSSGGTVTLLGHVPVPALCERIAASGVEFCGLARPHPDPADLRATLTLLDRIRSIGTVGGPTWTVLDGYHFDARYRDAVAGSGSRLLVIDDLARRPPSAADIVLNQNLGAGEAGQECAPRTVLLLGPCYALLRPEFAAARGRHVTRARARKILVTLGGADPPNATSLVLCALRQLPFDDWSARVIVGAANRHRDSLRREVRGCQGRAELIESGADMAACMAWADVAVSAAGSTCWELAYMRVPSLLLVIADNQEPSARAADAAGMAVNLGWAEHLTPSLLAERLAELCHDRRGRKAMADSGGRCVDGGGTSRVVALMQAIDGRLPAAGLTLRPAEAGDIWPIWRLANDPAVRRLSLSPRPIVPEEHAAWFDRRLNDPDTCFWVLDFHGVILGQIRYQRTGPGEAEISYSVAEPFRRRGLGVRMLRETQDQACCRLGVRRLRAVVRQENEPSARTFLKARFARIDGQHVQGHPCHVFQWTAEARCA
jgi:UDP-2,4-diacetamido-2,4,6-trideoxy-beta-L-altropyranose hydrolase